MADLSSLIKLHKYELDEKQRILSELYGQQQLIERQKIELQNRLEAERKAIEAREKEKQNNQNTQDEADTETGIEDLNFTLSGFIEKVKRDSAECDRQIKMLEQDIIVAKDELMTVFAELKKYEMTQAERDRLEAEEQKFRENQRFDEIALDIFRRGE